MRTRLHRSRFMLSSHVSDFLSSLSEAVLSFISQVGRKVVWYAHIRPEVRFNLEERSLGEEMSTALLAIHALQGSSFRSRSSPIHSSFASSQLSYLVRKLARSTQSITLSSLLRSVGSMRKPSPVTRTQDEATITHQYERISWLSTSLLLYLDH